MEAEHEIGRVSTNSSVTFSEIKAAMETDTELESLTTVNKQCWSENLAALSTLSVLTSGRNCHLRMSLCSGVKESWSSV